jgi:hypothetical protein
MVDLHRPMGANQMPTLSFRKVALKMVMRSLPQITIVFEYSPVRARQRKTFGRF